MKHITSFRSVLSMVLALVMIVSLPVAAFAEDGTVVSDPVDNGDGTSTVVTTTTSTSTDTEGNTTVTVTIEQDTTGTLNDGSNTNVVKEEVRTDSTVTNNDGVVIKEHFVEDGKETHSYEVEDDGSEADQPEVEVVLKPGETTTGEAVSTETTGDTPSGADDKNYDYTETTTTEREVTATTSDVTIKEESEDVELIPVAPESMTQTNNDGTTVQNHGYYKDGTKKDGIWNDLDPDEYYGYKVVGIPDPETNEVTYKLYNRSGEEIEFDGDYQFCGYGDDSFTYVDYNIVSYQKNADGNIMYGEDGKPLTKTSTSSADTIQFALQDKEGNLVYAYCVDLETYTKSGAFYDVANLEDNTYYADEESEAHIRAIVTNGYWGTSKGTGSIEKIRADLKAAIQNGKVENTVVETIKNEDGSTTDVLLSDIVDALTEGEALAVTQAAIWSWSNGSTAVNNGSVGEKVVGLGGWSVDGNNARMDALYTYLMSITDDGEKETIVIDDDSFLEEDGLKIVIGDKVEGHEYNRDDDSDNDVYNTALNFKLAFVPGKKDDLLVQISYTDLDGKPVNVVKRLAGKNAEGQNYEDILPEPDGSYLIKGLQLSENENFNFDLKLEGTQYLEQGVYVYSPVGGRKVSQTFVGMAEGNRDVDVSIGVTVSFDVDENNNVVAERVWHSEGDPSYKPTTNTNPEPVPLAVEPEEEVIEEEPVPLAKAPGTGSVSAIFAVAAAVSGMGLAGIVIGSKRKDEE